MIHLSEDQLQSYLDGTENTRRQEMEAHLAACLQCQRALAAYRQVFSVLAQPPETSLSPSFAAQVAREAYSTASESSQLTEWILFGISAVAGLAVTIYLLMSSLSQEYLATFSAVVHDIFAFAGGSKFLSSGKLPIFLFSIAVLLLVSLMDKLLLQRKA